MKKFINSILLSAMVLTPSVSLAEGFTGKTLSKTLRVSGQSAEAPIIAPGSLIPGVSTPCYSLEEVTEGDLDRLLAVSFFFASGAGADTTSAENAQARTAAFAAISLVRQGFSSEAIFAFLQVQLRVVYGCN